MYRFKSKCHMKLFIWNTVLNLLFITQSLLFFMRYGYGSLILQNSIYLGIKMFWVCSFGRYIRLKGIGAPFLQSQLTCSKTVTSLAAQSDDHNEFWWYVWMDYQSCWGSIIVEQKRIFSLIFVAPQCKH